MPVIIDPKPQKSVMKEVVCYAGCGALIGYVPNDRKDGVDVDYTGGRDHYYYVSCPQCNKEIRVK